MLRRSILSLLAGVLIILAPIVTASPDTNAVGAADSPTRFRSQLPRSRHSVREPIHRVHRLPRNSAASSAFPQLVHSASTIFSGTVHASNPVLRMEVNRSRRSPSLFISRTRCSARFEIETSPSPSGWAYGPAANDTASANAFSYFCIRAVSWD